MKQNTEFKTLIASQIMANRPKLSESSLSSYVSTLANIPKKLEGENSIEFLEDNTDAILDFYKNTPVNKRKSVMSAIQVLTNKKNSKIETQMLDDIKEYNNQNQEQKKTQSESNNWIHWSDVVKIHTSLGEKALPLLKNKTKTILTGKEIELLNQYILLSFFVYMPPRRSLDYAIMKIKNFGIEDNYITKNGEIVFNIYKTAKHYGKQSFQLPPQLKLILIKWRKINNTDYLLVNPTKQNENKPFNSVQINRMFNQIFDKKISVDILRHSYITKFYSGLTPSQSEINDLSFKMAHSASQNMLYRRVE